MLTNLGKRIELLLITHKMKLSMDSFLDAIEEFEAMTIKYKELKNTLPKGHAASKQFLVDTHDTIASSLAEELKSLDKLFFRLEVLEQDTLDDLEDEDSEHA